MSYWTFYTIYQMYSMLELASTVLKYIISIKYVSISISCAYLCASARRGRTLFMEPPRACYSWSLLEHAPQLSHSQMPAAISKEYSSRYD